MPEPGKSTKQLHPQALTQFGTVLCSDKVVMSQVRFGMEENSQTQVLMLGEFHKRGEVEILVSFFIKNLIAHAVTFRIQQKAKTPKPLISAIG